VVVAVAGCFLNTINPLGVSLGQHLAPQHASVISGVLMGLAWAPASCTQWLAGTLAEHPSVGPAGTLMIVGVLIVPALALTWFLPGDHPSIGQQVTKFPDEMIPSSTAIPMEPSGDLHVETDEGRDGSRRGRRGRPR